MKQWRLDWRDVDHLRARRQERLDRARVDLIVVAFNDNSRVRPLANDERLIFTTAETDITNETIAAFGNRLDVTLAERLP